jgi:hypothetical protein
MFPQTRHISTGKIKKKVEITNLDHKFFHVVNIWQGLKFLKSFSLTFCQIWLSPYCG